MANKTLAEWEKAKNSIVIDATESELKKRITEDEFDSIPQDKRLSVFYDERVEFLQDNGYKVTRKNMVDVSLSARPKKKK